MRHITPTVSRVNLVKVLNLRKAGRTILALAALLLLASVALRHPSALLRAGAQDVALAQSSDGYDLSWWTADGGGSTFSTGDGYTLGGTVGQFDVSVWEGSGYTLAGGFWGGALIEYHVYLPLVLRDF